jgi:hypothetical protein
MKRLGPLNGSGPGSESNLGIAGQHPHTSSDTGAASLSPNSSASQLRARSSDTALRIALKARGRSRFDALLDGVQIVKASKNPISDAARVLHRMGYPDHLLLVAHHEGAAHYAMRGSLRAWRKVRIREDRGLRYVAWEPPPRRVVAKNDREKSKDGDSLATRKNASAATPGAAKGRSKARREAIRPPERQS